MHPDERMLMMVSERVSIPDRLYPDFFNYGTLPIYILKGFVQILSTQTGALSVTMYGPGLLSSARFLSTIFDLGTMIGIYLVVKLIWRKKGDLLALLATLSYGLFMFFTIQNSHFFVVDVFVTFFLTFATLSMLLYMKKGNLVFLLLQAVFIGLSVASKFTAILFVPGCILTILAAQVLSQKSDLSKKLINSVLIVTTWSIFAFGSFALTMPYALIPPSGILTKFATKSSNPTNSWMTFSWQAVDETVDEFKMFFDKETFPTIRFLRDMKEQTRMNTDPYVFPYTLQYAGTLPYLYYLKNIVVWGVGPFVSVWIAIGSIYFLMSAVKHRRSILIFTKKTDPQILLISIFFFSTFCLFFLIIGKSAVKFMRYMLPLYPILAIIAAYGLMKMFEYKGQVAITRIKVFDAAKIATVILAALWSMAFLQIYQTDNTRAQATDWILQNIPAGSTLGVEHWDDRVPIRSGEMYKYEEINMYDRPDDSYKWSPMNTKLSRVDYYIIASNRLYAPLQRLTDCSVHGHSCYPIASKFYADLLSNKTNFKKVAEFTSYPRLGPLVIPDDGADESFTVYDHPKIIVLKNSQ